VSNIQVDGHFVLKLSVRRRTHIHNQPTAQDMATKLVGYSVTHNITGSRLSESLEAMDSRFKLPTVSCITVRSHTSAVTWSDARMLTQLSPPRPHIHAMNVGHCTPPENHHRDSWTYAPHIIQTLKVCLQHTK